MSLPLYASRTPVHNYKLYRPSVMVQDRRARHAYNQFMFADKYDDPLRGDDDYYYLSSVAGKNVARNDSSESLAGSSDADASADTDADADADADAGITYTFDHATGPTSGDQILGDALAVAVERFETTQTERLVNKEYEVLDGEGEAVRSGVLRGDGAVGREGGSGVNAARRRARKARRREDVLSHIGSDDGFELV